MSKYSEEIRAAWSINDARRNKGLTVPKGIDVYSDISYGDAGDFNLLDVYIPSDSPHSKHPVVVSIHGGAYVYGTKEIYRYYLMSIAKRGFAAVNFNYRLAPEYQFPAALEDANKVIKWIFENSEQYGFDTKNIFLVGDSAGAHYTSLYAALCTNKKYSELLNIAPPENFVPNAICLNCGLYDTSFAINNDPRRIELLTDLLKDKIDDASVLMDLKRYMTKDFPPTFAMTSWYDMLKDHQPFLVNLLKENSVEYVSKLYGNENTKEAGHVFHVNVKHNLASICNDEECEFLRSHIV